MSREGLVQRKTAAQASGGAAAKDDDDEAHSQRPLDDDKDNDDDGKSTRLTLMEEVLLLGLKDREVVVIFCIFAFNYATVVTYCSLLECEYMGSATLSPHFWASRVQPK